MVTLGCLVTDPEELWSLPAVHPPEEHVDDR